MPRLTQMAAIMAIATVAACSSGPPEPSLGARMADMIDRDIQECSAGSQAACMRYHFDSQAVLQFLAPVPPTQYGLTVNRGFGW